MVAKTRLVGVKMSTEMFEFLSKHAQKDDVTIQELIRKTIKKVMSRYG